MTSPQPIVDWTRVDTVLLDMDGTLLDLHFDNYFWLEFLPNRVATLRGMSLEECQDRLFAQMHARHGTLSWYDTAYWSKFLDIDVMAIKQEVASRIAWRPGALEFLGAVKASERPMILATNADRSVMGLKFANTGLDTHVDRLVSSHDYGFPKEDQRFWERLIDDTGIDPARSVFIDDSTSVLESASQFGVGQVLAPLTPDTTAGPRDDHEFVTIARFADIHP